MTSADKRRVRKALEGAGFPADKQTLFQYAAERGIDAKTHEALAALPDREYDSIAEVESSVPQSPSAELGES